jgi:lysozyme
MNETALFDAIRKIKGKGLLQSEVDLVRAALASSVVAASHGMMTSPVGVALIHSFESLKLVSYKDPGSVDGKPITNGWGTTRDEDGKPIKLGVIWSREKGDRLFARDLRDVEIGVNLLLQGKPTTQSQFDALVSFAYNVGLDIDEDTKAEGLGDSALLRFHLAGQYASAKAAFASWKFNDGKVMKGLVNRRAAEAALYGKAA